MIRRPPRSTLFPSTTLFTRVCVVQLAYMPTFRIETREHGYSAIVERGIAGQAARFLPARAGKVFVVTTQDVWAHQGETLTRGLDRVAHEELYFPGGEERKRLAPLEQLAEE